MSIFTLPVSGPITNPYSSSHPGIDFGVPVGTPVRATADGVISGQGLMGDGGNTIIIQHSNGYESVYAHLSSFLLQPGTQVKQGEIIGFSGGAKGASGSGNSTGPHLHFQLDKGKGAANHVDPTALLGLLPSSTSTSQGYQNKMSILDQIKKTILVGPLGAILSTKNPASTAIISNVPGASAAQEAVKGFTSTADLIGFISNPTNLRRVGMGAIGVALIVITGVKLLSDSEIGGKITEGAKTVAVAA